MATTMVYVRVKEDAKQKAERDLRAMGCRCRALMRVATGKLFRFR